MRSMPNRARSNLLAAVAMNSIAQHAVPNGMGHSEFERPQLTSEVESRRDPASLPLVGSTVTMLGSGRAPGFGLAQSHCSAPFFQT